MCTDFSMKARARNNSDVFMVGRTMELGPNLGSELFFRPRNYEFNQNPEETFFDALRSTYNTGENKILVHSKLMQGQVKNIYSWKGKYGFVGMNAFKQHMAANGMNTKGLTTGTMVLGQSKYQPFFSKKDCQSTEDMNGENVLFYPSLTNWILSNCKDCQDVINKLSVDKIAKNLGLRDENPTGGYVVVNPFVVVPNAFKFHFPVHDALGNSIVLEYTKGKLRVSNLADIGVLTNDPLIAWQQENVKNNYAGIMPFNVQNADGNPLYGDVGNNFVCKTNAQGTGFEGLPGSSTPVDRFVRAAMMTNFSFPVTQITDPEFTKEDLTDNEICDFVSEGISIDDIGVKDATTLAFHILNTVDIPMGTSRDPLVKNVHDYTQWATVSDLTNKTYTIRMYGSPQVFTLHVNELNLEGLKDTVFAIPVKEKAIDITKEINAKAPAYQKAVV